MDHQEPLPPPQQEPQQYSTRDMVLYDHEIRWAYEIKEAIEANETLKPICDMEVAQFAICTCADPFGVDPAQTGTSLEEVLDRVYKLQCFREHYGFENRTFTVEDGCRLLGSYLQQQQPGHLVTIDYLPSQGNYMIVWDRAAFHPSRVKQEADWKIYQGATYSIFLVLSSNLRATRSGVEVILECDGMGVKNYDSAFEERRVNELFSYYPFVNKEFHFLNTPTVAILLYQMVKPFLNKQFHKTVKLDAKLEGYEGQRIDTLYNVPTFEYAQNRLLQRLEEYLRERFHHQKNYRLPPLPSPNNDLLNNDAEAMGDSQHSENNNNGNMMDDGEEDFDDASSVMSMVGDY